MTIGTSLLLPFLPDTCAKALAQLNTAPRSFDVIDQWGLYPNGNQVSNGQDKLFVRLDAAKVQEQWNNLVAPPQAAQPEEPKAEVKPVKPTIDIDTFGAADLRVGKILKCEKVPKASKLLVSQVDLGEDKPRQIVSGIARSYTPEQMVGKTVIAVVNLAPVTLCGVRSEGMLLCATGADGRAILLTPEADCAAGSEVR